MSVADEILRIQQAKEDLKTAIEAKGVTVPAATTIDGYAALVDQIQQGGGTLPYDAGIAYLESTGTQYIDTGIKPSGISNIRVVTSVECSNANRRVILGSFSTANAGDKGLSIEIQKDSTNNKLRLYTINNTSAVNFMDTHSLTLNKPINIDITLNCASNTWSGTLSNNNSSYNISASASSGMDTQLRNFRLYLDHRASTSVIAYPLKMYFLKIYIDNQMVRHFIPVRVGTTGEMYDKVSQTLFGNLGTGSFVLGPDVT